MSSGAGGGSGGGNGGQSTKPSAPPGGGATSLGSGRDYSPSRTSTSIGGGGGGRDYSSIPASTPTRTVAPTPTRTVAPTNTGGGDNNYQDRIQRIATGTEPGYRPQDEQPFGLSKEEAYRQGRITKDQLEAPVVLESQVIDERSPFQVGFENIIDFYKEGGILGAGLRGLSSLGESVQQKAMEFGLNTKINRLVNKSGSTPRENNIIYQNELAELRSDLDAVRSGEFGQSDYTSKYGSGDTTNPLDANFDPNSLTSDEQQGLQNLFTPELAYSVSGQTPQESMVNQYFGNMGTTQGSPLSSDLQRDYNSAKNNINSLLGITPPSQQFGYSADPYGGLMANNLTTNPYNIDYLKRLGLI
jgi:hypothetical protein